MVAFNIYNKPFKSLGYPKLRVKFREGLQKIYLQNLKKKENKKGKKDEGIKRSKAHNIYTLG